MICQESVIGMFLKHFIVLDLVLVQYAKNIMKAQLGTILSNGKTSGMFHLDFIASPRLSFGDGKTILPALLSLSMFQMMITLRIGLS